MWTCLLIRYNSKCSTFYLQKEEKSEEKTAESMKKVETKPVSEEKVEKPKSVRTSRGGARFLKEVTEAPKLEKSQETEKVASDKVSTKNDSSENNSTEKKLSEKDSTEEPTKKESTEQSLTEKESTEKESTEKDSTEKHSTEKDSTEKDATEKVATEKDSTEKGSTEKDSNEKDSNEKDSTEVTATEEVAPKEAKSEESLRSVAIADSKPETPKTKSILTPEMRSRGKKYHDIQIILLESEMEENGRYHFK